jgi:hypothetical protein
MPLDCPRKSNLLHIQAVISSISASRITASRPRPFQLFDSSAGLCDIFQILSMLLLAVISSPFRYTTIVKVGDTSDVRRKQRS